MEYLAYFGAAALGAIAIFTALSAVALLRMRGDVAGLLKDIRYNLERIKVIAGSANNHIRQIRFQNFETGRNVELLIRKTVRESGPASGSLAPFRERSVVFLHNSYYHFHYLSKALRARGWDAVTVSMEDPASPNSRFYHGADINLYSPDPEQFRRRLNTFFTFAKQRYSMMHFYGEHTMGFFPENFDMDKPADIIEWKNLGKKVAYSISGCLSCTAQSSFADWSARDGGQACCDKCQYPRPEICSDEKNLRWGKKVDEYCDLIFAETHPALDYLRGPKVVREPVTSCLDTEFWRPNLPIPAGHVVDRSPGEILVYHGVANHDSRTSSTGDNIKGTKAIMEAVERLNREGLKVRLLFATNAKNSEVRYLQAQADIIADQLNIGRYGATAREGMMLGKPVICYINRTELSDEDRLFSLREAPLVSARENTIYAALKELAMNREKRVAIGEASRRYAVKWHGAEGCAERYEKIYDNLMTGVAGGYPYPSAPGESSLARLAEFEKE